MAEGEKGASLPDILKDGYGYSPKRITRETSLSVEAKAIYSYLASFADENGKAYPGIELMCHELNISEKRFHRHKKQLIDQGFITVERERTDNGWSNNIYTLLGYSVTSHFVPLQIVPLRNVPLQNVTLQNDPTIITSLNNTSLNNTNIKKKDNVEQKPDPIPYRQIIDYLNQKAGKSFKHAAAANKKIIKARWNEGYKLEDFKRCIDNKVVDWKDKTFKDGTDANKYLQPSTLFGNKFDQYLNQKPKYQRPVDEMSQRIVEHAKASADEYLNRPDDGVDLPF